MSSESSSVQYMSTYIKGGEMHSWTSPQITKASYCASFLTKTQTAWVWDGSFSYIIKYLQIQAVLIRQSLCHLWHETQSPAVPHSCSDNKNPLVWGLRSYSFPDRAWKQLTTGWVVRRSTWNSLGCYHRRFWVENAKGTVERRKYVLVDQWEHYLVWFVFCFPLAVGEECKQSSETDVKLD